MVLAPLLLAGCHAQARPARLRPVTARLDVLVRSHPGWPGVALYDQMLTRLRTSAHLAQAGLGRPVPPMTLAGLSGLDLPGGSFTLPAGTLEGQRRLLAQLGQEQMARLRERRAQARAQQLRAQTRVWRSEARRAYDQAVADADVLYARDYGDAFAADSALRLNLALQIRALEKTVGHWTLSTPPTPRLDRARQDLAAKRLQLALLQSRQAGALAGLVQARAATLARAAAARVAFVADERTQTAAHLRALDEAALAAQRVLLARETAGLLAREGQLVAAALPGAGTLGPLSLPGGVPPAPAGTALGDAEAQLETQRARWVRGLYAEDAGRRRRHGPAARLGTGFRPAPAGRAGQDLAARRPAGEPPLETMREIRNVRSGKEERKCKRPWDNSPR